jgi:lipoprotein signal peptidase
VIAPQKLRALRALRRWIVLLVYHSDPTRFDLSRVLAYLLVVPSANDALATDTTDGAETRAGRAGSCAAPETSRRLTGLKPLVRRDRSVIQKTLCLLSATSDGRRAAVATCGPSSAIRKRLVHIVVPVLLIGITTDQASKWWATRRPDEARVLVAGYLAAYPVQNAGCVLGIGRDQAGTSKALALLGIVCAALLVRIAYTDRRRWQGTEFIAGALLLAGIFGNALDRFALGHVRDFLVTWAIPTVAFNVADLLLFVGSTALFMSRLCGCRRA